MDLKRGDVLHYHTNKGDESYVLIEDARQDGHYVRYRALCLDDGQVYTDINFYRKKIPERNIRVERPKEST